MSLPTTSVTGEVAAAGGGPVQEARSVLGSLLRGWDRFWFSRMDPTTLCFIRLCCGLLTFYVHLTYSWGLLSYVGPEAWIDHEIARVAVGGDHAAGGRTVLRGGWRGSSAGAASRSGF